MKRIDHRCRNVVDERVLHGTSYPQRFTQEPPPPPPLPLTQPPPPERLTQVPPPPPPRPFIQPDVVSPGKNTAPATATPITAADHFLKPWRKSRRENMLRCSDSFASSSRASTTSSCSIVFPLSAISLVALVLAS
ncbi:MAG: hypothetical protein DMF69_14740 [Acidobacteria bacterium]|nr:MAG: hypothetical protein DMF69_14740 [Acidobacteriota bacterium]